MTKMVFDLTARRRIHVVGVGGPGMSAIATALFQMGHDVSGSDIKSSPVIDRLVAMGVRINIGHDRSVVRGCDAVTASTAIPESNIEIDEAKIGSGAILTRAQMLAAICALQSSVAVAGTHGKTTTTALLVRIFSHAGLDPNFIVGGDLLEEGVGARWTGSRWTIVEADESDGTHLQLPLFGTILTNIDSDHLDQYGDFAGIVECFRTYVHQIEGPVVACIDDPSIRTLDLPEGSITYGFDPEARFRCHSIESTEGETRFALTVRPTPGTTPGTTVHTTVHMTLRGRHNVLNVTAALAMAVACGIDLAVAVAAIPGFGGVGRRFHIIGKSGGITFVDDYAHLPREIAAVMAAAKSSGDQWGRVVAVFQPNRYNRMAVMSNDYGAAFVDADLVVITDIYASGTAVIPGITGHLVVEAVRALHPNAKILWHADRSSLADFVSKNLLPGDVCISMGCGDIEYLPREILALGVQGSTA